SVISGDAAAAVTHRQYATSKSGQQRYLRWPLCHERFALKVEVNPRSPYHPTIKQHVVLPTTVVHGLPVGAEFVSPCFSFQLGQSSGCSPLNRYYCYVVVVRVVVVLLEDYVTT